MGRKIPCTIQGIEYPSRTAAARALGVKCSHVTYALRAGTTHRLGCGQGGPEPIPVRIRGVIYPGGAPEAARKLGVTPSAIYRALSLGDPDRIGRSRGRKGGHSTGKEFRVGRLVWPSRLAAERDLGLPRQYISQAINSGRASAMRRIAVAAMKLQAERDAERVRERDIARQREAA